MTATFTQYIALTGAVEEPWIPRSYGRHSDTRYLDEPTIPVWFLLMVAVPLALFYRGPLRDAWRAAAN